MSVKVVHICGPAGGGKTTIARGIARRLRDDPPRYLRFVRDDPGDPPQLSLHEPMPEMRSTSRCFYTPERVYEQVPAALTHTGPGEPCGVVLMETNTEPCFRLAHTYDLRVFVLPGPAHVDEVFRTSDEAAQALRCALQDTTLFAREVFGMDRIAGLDDSGSAAAAAAGAEGSAAALTEDPLELERVLCTSLGTEIAARVRLQPSYHTLLDSDVVILNAGTGAGGEVVDICARRLERLIDSLPIGVARRPRFFCCDPEDEHDPLGKRSLDLITSLIRGQTAGRA